MDGGVTQPVGAFGAQDLVAAITARQSGKVTEPAPDRGALQRAFAAAFAAPDHKALRPWRFFVVQGEARAAFGEVLGRCLQESMPDTIPEMVEKERGKALRAPMIVVAAARITQGCGVPEIEQVLATGAATENFLLALHAQGFSGAWKTGGAAYSPVMKRALGLGDQDHVVGILYVGTPVGALPPRQAVETADFASDWSGARD